MFKVVSDNGIHTVFFHDAIQAQFVDHKSAINFISGRLKKEDNLYKKSLEEEFTEEKANELRRELIDDATRRARYSVYEWFRNYIGNNRHFRDLFENKEGVYDKFEADLRKTLEIE